MFKIEGCTFVDCSGTSNEIYSVAKFYPMLPSNYTIDEIKQRLSNLCIDINVFKARRLRSNRL